jgi:hypothetical protein
MLLTVSRVQLERDRQHACGGGVGFDGVDREPLVGLVRCLDGLDAEDQVTGLGVADVLRDGGVVAHGVVVPPGRDVDVGGAQFVDEVVQAPIVGTLAGLEPQRGYGVAGEDVPAHDALARQGVEE